MRLLAFDLRRELEVVYFNRLLQWEGDRQIGCVDHRRTDINLGIMSDRATSNREGGFSQRQLHIDRVDVRRFFQGAEGPIHFHRRIKRLNACPEVKARSLTQPDGLRTSSKSCNTYSVGLVFDKSR